MLLGGSVSRITLGKPQKTSTSAYSSYSPSEEMDNAFAESLDLSTYSPTSITLVNETEKSNSTILHNISELIWLNTTQPSITLNENNTVYQVLLNTVSKWFMW